MHARWPALLANEPCSRPRVGSVGVRRPEGDLLGVRPLTARLCCYSLDQLTFSELVLLVVREQRLVLLLEVRILLLSQPLLLFLRLECGFVIDEAVYLTVCARQVLVAVVEAFAGRIEARSSGMPASELPRHVDRSKICAIFFASVRLAAVPGPEVSRARPSIHFATVVHAAASSIDGCVLHV